jgi:hypothetical protein
LNPARVGIPPEMIAFFTFFFGAAIIFQRGYSERQKARAAESFAPWMILAFWRPQGDWKPSKAQIFIGLFLIAIAAVIMLLKWAGRIAQ